MPFCKRLWPPFLVALSTLWGSVAAQTLPTTEEFQNLLQTCAAGAEINIDADLMGSLTSIYAGEQTQGTLTAGNVGAFLNLLPEEDRAAAYELYTKCITDILGRIEEKDVGASFWGLTPLEWHQVVFPLERHSQTFDDLPFIQHPVSCVAPKSFLDAFEIGAPNFLRKDPGLAWPTGSDDRPANAFLEALDAFRRLANAIFFFQLVTDKPFAKATCEWRNNGYNVVLFDLTVSPCFTGVVVEEEVANSCGVNGRSDGDGHEQGVCYRMVIEQRVPRRWFLNLLGERRSITFQYLDNAGFTVACVSLEGPDQQDPMKALIFALVDHRYIPAATLRRCADGDYCRKFNDPPFNHPLY